jgi:GntR family transcriptional regulator
MQFFIDTNSVIPVATQIQEQIKLAVMMGVFRKGDTLPSIRDIEKQTGINRNQIHKAYLALRKSGLLVLTRGKGSVVAAATEAPRTTEGSCRKLSKNLISRVREMGLSPTSFVRYLSRYVRENELNAPFIVYVDSQQEIASRTAEEISKLWRVPVAGLALHNLKAALGRGKARRKILVNHISCEKVKSLLPRNKSDVIPIELRTLSQIEKDLKKIRSNSSVMVVHRPQPLHNIQFILAPLRIELEPRGIQLSSYAIRDTSAFRELVKESRHDYYLVGPGAWPDVPPDLRQDSRIIQLGVQLDPASLEAARVRAGVII